MPGFISQLCSVILGNVLNSQCWFYLKNECHNLQFSSVSQSCLPICDPMDCSTPGFPVHHQLPELAQTHVHRVGDAIQPSPAFNFPASASFPMSQFFTSGGQSTGHSFHLQVKPCNLIHLKRILVIVTKSLQSLHICFT